MNINDNWLDLENMPNKICRGFDAAIDVAISDNKHNYNKNKTIYHGAVIYKSGSIIGSGFNTLEPIESAVFGNGNNCHAEISALENAFINNRTLYMSARQMSKRSLSLRGKQKGLREIRD